MGNRQLPRLEAPPARKGASAPLFALFVGSSVRVTPLISEILWGRKRRSNLTQNLVEKISTWLLLSELHIIILK